MAYHTNAQYENLLHKPFNQKHDQLIDLYFKKLDLYGGDSAEVAKRVDTLRQFAIRHNDATLVKEAGYAVIMNKLWHNNGGSFSPAADMEVFAEQCVKEKDLVMACRSYRVLANYCWDHRLYEQAFDVYFKLLEILAQLSPEEYIEKSVEYACIGNAFYYFRDYRKAAGYTATALRLPFAKSNISFKYSAQSLIGLCYQKMGMPDSSDYFFTQTVNAAANGVNNQWYGIACGNLGYNAFLRHDYGRAIPLLQTDIDTAIAFGDFGLAAGSLMPMAEIRLAQGNIASAEALASQAREYIVTSGQYSRYEHLFPLLSRLHLAKDNHKLASAYLDSSLQVKDSLTNRFSGLQLARAQERWQINNRKAALAQLEAEKNSKTMQRNMLLGFSILLLFISVFIYRLIKKRHRQNQLVKDLQLRQKEAELVSATLQLNDFAEHISQKTALLENMEQQLRQRGAEDESILEHLRQSSLLTDEQWEKFRTLFESVHAGYLHRLREKIPALTPAETRFMALAKLRFTNKEMAATLGISPQTIRVTWHRLRKKLNLPEDGNLDELLSSI